MSAFNTSQPYVQINDHSIIFIRGEHKGVVTLETMLYGSLNNVEMAKKIAEKFHGPCIQTNEWGTQDPVFIFTVNAGEAIKNVQWFLRMVRSKLDEMMREVDHLNKPRP